MLGKNKNIKKDIVIILLLWICLSAFNLNKAFTFDDAFHLEAAQWIADNPLRPMSGKILWNKGPAQYFYEGNQPPLYFYQIAIIGELFGYQEIPLHIFQSIFSLIALIYFYRIMKIINGRMYYDLIVLFTFCPALIINQNLMIDVPILSLILASLFYLLRAHRKSAALNYSISILLASLAFLMKYSAFPILLLIPVVGLLRKDIKYWYVMFIPLILLSAWSVWNVWEFGNIHLLGRKDSVDNRYTSTVGATIEFTMTLGSAIFLSLPLVFSQLKSRSNLIGIGLFIIYIVMACLFSALDITEGLLGLFFLINGMIMISWLIIYSRKKLIQKDVNKILADNRTVLLLYLFCQILFLIFLSPFIASRHVLLAIPVIIILLYGPYMKSSRTVKILTLSITISAGFFLGISDWANADIYRTYPKEDILPKERRIFTIGHWGWQWYAPQKGIVPYVPEKTKLIQGDLFIFPGFLAYKSQAQRLPKHAELEIIKEVPLDSRLIRPLKTHDMYRFITEFQTPWSFAPQGEKLVWAQVKLKDIEKDSD